mmetsp:Transcript_54043/g.149865  ORF Transcript_54043/g.149865 Transcript_54043/m.149865 type:complete len:276 (+) Transcript_54043:81-908(+)
MSRAVLSRRLRCRQRRTTAQSHIVGLKGAPRGHPDAELHLHVLHVPGIGPAAVHLRGLHADLLGHALLVILVSGVYLDVPISLLGDEELQRACVPEVLAADEILLLVCLILHHDGGAAQARHSSRLEVPLAVLLHDLDVELHLHVLLQVRVPVVRYDTLPQDEDLVVGDDTLLVRNDEAVALELVVCDDRACVSDARIHLEVCRQRRRPVGAAALAAPPALAALALAPALAPAALAPAAGPDPRHGLVRAKAAPGGGRCQEEGGSAEERASACTP